MFSQKEDGPSLFYRLRLQRSRLVKTTAAIRPENRFPQESPLGQHALLRVYQQISLHQPTTSTTTLKTYTTLNNLYHSGILAGVDSTCPTFPSHGKLSLTAYTPAARATLATTYSPSSPFQLSAQLQSLPKQHHPRPRLR